MHRSTLSAATAALGLTLVIAGTGTAVSSSAAAPPSAATTANGPKVIKVDTDTPLGRDQASRPGAPIAPGPFRLTQPDGTRITLTAWGDSEAHGYQTEDGYAVARDAAGVWRYALRADAAGRAVPSSLEVGQAKPPAAAKTLRDRVAARAAAARRATPVPALPSPGTGTGSQPELVILVSFPDQPPVGSTEDQWAAAYFGAGYTVASYFQQNSFGKFALTPAAETGGVPGNGVVGWLQLPYAHPDFGGNYDARETKLAVDAIKAANPYVDYKSFDTNHNGVLSPSELHVTVIVAGYETAYGGPGSVCGNSVWGHQSSLLSSGPRVDGTTVGRNGYTMFGEWDCAYFDTPGHMATMGIMAHELGHDIGFPDLYDIDQTSDGLGEWSLMSGGSWNTVGTAPDGAVPAGLDAFSKSYQGWITPTPVVGSTVGASLPAATTSPAAFRLGENPRGVDWKFQSHRGRGEYFLVENRQLAGFDASLPACGVIVYHVDERVTSTNEANADDAHRLVDVVEADGLNQLDTYGYRGSAADVFPGSSGHVDFSDATVPAAILYSGKPSGASLHVSGGCGDPVAVNVATPLPNDAFAAAKGLPGSSGRVSGGNNGATKEAGEPAVAANPGGASVWWTFKAPANGTLRLNTAGSTFDTLLGVYRGGQVAALTEIASNDNATPTDPASAVTAKVKRGTTYHVAVDGQNLGAGPGQGAISLGYLFRPANDALRDAATLKGKHGKKRSSTVGATKERKEPRKIAGKKSSKTVWYKYRAKKAGRLTLDLSGSKFNTLIAVYTGSKMKKLHKVAANDNGGKGRSSRVTVRLKKGKTYRICVAGVKGADGKFLLRWHR